MRRLSRLIPIIGGAVAGGVIALVVASGSTTTHSVTTTVVQPSSASTIPTSLTAGRGLTVNQIYRSGESRRGGHHRHAAEPGAGIRPRRRPRSRRRAKAPVSSTTTKGDILTDEHVVSGATSVTVHFQDGLKASAKVLGTDPSTDVAVIRVNVPASELHPIAFADSSQAQVGDPVVAIGSPFSLPETTTAGIVSQIGRSITGAEQLHDRRRDPDRRGDQPGQLRRSAARCERPRAGAQRSDPDQLRLERRRRASRSRRTRSRGSRTRSSRASRSGTRTSASS